MVITLINAEAKISIRNIVDGSIHEIPKVYATVITAESGVVGSIKQYKNVVGTIAEVERDFVAQSVRPIRGNYVDFFKVEDYKLVILGAWSVVETENGLYIDCSPEEEWIDPVLVDGILTIRQAYSIRKTDTVLEVR